MQIQQTAAQSQKALNASLQQSSSKDRERRILQLTIDEISQMKGDVKLYKGVGKMSVICLCEPPALVLSMSMAGLCMFPGLPWKKN